MKTIKHTLDALQQHDTILNGSMDVATLRKRQVGYNEQLELLERVKMLRKSYKQAFNVLKILG